MSPRSPEQFESIRQAKRKQILLASLNLFANKGYQNTSIGEIALQAGISKGLLYNYFESKESILLQLVYDYITETTGLLNPNNDGEITNREMEMFLDGLIASLAKENNLWKLYLQLSVQPVITDLVKNLIKDSRPMLTQLQLLDKYFAERFVNPQQEIIFFTSLIEGFIVQYLLAPESFSSENLQYFLNRIKGMILVDKLKNAPATHLKT
jgi:AcrR family transcriptional regulator